MATSLYCGRFAPSPTGPLHMGSLVAAIASYLDAKAHQGRWLLRIEDVDFDRNVSGADQAILASLSRCGMQWDGEVEWQSQRTHHYQTAIERLHHQIYACGCSRKEIADSHLRSGLQTNQIYPGTCRQGLREGRQARSWRLRVPEVGDGAAIMRFTDRWQGEQTQNLATEVGDFVLKRADGFWAYQLAVVVDDAAQGITDIVRGADLIDSTARQIYLQQRLNLPPLRYLHVPIVVNAQGEKLSKQTGATAFDLSSNAQDLLRNALLPAAAFLGMQLPAVTSITHFWESAIVAWREKLQ